MKQIQVGDKIPSHVFSTYTSYEARESEKKSTEELFGGKKVVLIGLPGAFTPVCSTKQVPGFLEMYDKFKELSVDELVCTSVNDGFVMKEWYNTMGVNLKKLAMMPDPDGSFHAKLGLTQYLEELGTRCLRYSMIINDGTIESLHVEQPGGQTYSVSTPEKILEDLQRKAKEK